MDDDNAVRLERLRKERDLSLKEVVNDVIRRGLKTLDAPAEKRAPLRTQVFDSGEPAFRTAQELKDLIARLDEEDELRRLGRA